MGDNGGIYLITVFGILTAVTLLWVNYKLHPPTRFGRLFFWINLVAFLACTISFACILLAHQSLNSDLLSILYLCTVAPIHLVVMTTVLAIANRIYKNRLGGN